jgi:hypothetical protein
MIPLAWPALGLFAVAAVGALFDRALRLELRGLGAARWPLAALLGLGAVLAIALHPLALLALGLLLFLARSRTAKRERSTGLDAPARFPLALLAGIALIVALRPPAPIYWDELVWLGKARLAASSPLALREASLDAAADVIPRGYPMFAPLASALFGGLRDDVPALVAGAAGLVVLAFAIALVLWPAERRGPWLVALALAPLVWVHARSAYVDLVVGLFALAVALVLERARRGDRRALPMGIVAAFVVAGLKDEGALHVLAVALASVLATRDRGAVRDAGLVIAGAILSLGTWRVLLAIHGVTGGDHTLDPHGLRHAGAILAALARSVADVRSWGLAWPIAIGALIVRVVRRDASAASITWIVQLALTVGVILVGNERLQAFVLGGTLLHRLLMQLAPTAAWCVIDTLARLQRTSKTAQGCQSR